MSHLPLPRQKQHFNGIYADIFEIIGGDATERLYQAFAGLQITLPVRLYSREFVAQCVLAEYNGYNAKQLARQFGYSEKWIRKLIKEYGKGECGDGL